MMQQQPGHGEAMARINHVAAMFGGGPRAHENNRGHAHTKQPQGQARQTAEPEAKATERDQAKPNAPPKTDKLTWAAIREKLERLNEKANSGDRRALEELRQLLDQHPEVCNHIGDLAQIAENSWLELLTEGDVLGREATKRQLASRKANLAGDHPTPLEELLVDNVTVAYLAQRHAEIREANDAGGSLQQAAYRLKRSESSQRRYLAAIKTLATLRAKAPAGLAPLKGLKLHDPERKHA